MQNDRFEWDDRKAAANRRKHGISFELARVAFEDTEGQEDLDDSDDEERVRLIGMALGRLLLVVYTRRPPRIRIISARKANRHDELRYFGKGR